MTYPQIVRVAAMSPQKGSLPFSPSTGKGSPFRFRKPDPPASQVASEQPKGVARVVGGWKFCAGCEETKHVSEFPLNGSGKYRSRCRTCRNAKRRKQRSV